MTDEMNKTSREQVPHLTDADIPDGMPFPVIAIGASAGGLQALKAFFKELPEKPGAAFVVITHMEPSKKSLLAEILARFTKLAIREAEHGQRLEPNVIFIIPPGRTMTISKGALEVQARADSKHLFHPIDIFLNSLANYQGRDALCVILSGTGTDGTDGLRDIKESGGVAIVQDPDTAAYSGMPQSAEQTGIADLVLPIDEIPAAIVRYLQTTDDVSRGLQLEQGTSSEEAITKLLATLRIENGHDFSTYKMSTIGRRIQKRMLLVNLSSLTAYLKLVQEDANERLALVQDLLIGVTRFFRDEEAFESLRRRVLPNLFKNKGAGDTIRVWVAGCSTGEEAYSIAILISEHMKMTRRECNVKILATDIDKRAVEKARRGVYSATIAENLNPMFLTKYFTLTQKGYSVRPELRDMVVFAHHDLLRDPPFFQLDLISCRNLLIYLKADAQKKSLSYFYYALGKDGVLFLGPSDTIGSHTNLFAAVDKQSHLFRKLSGGRGQIGFPFQPFRHLAFDNVPSPALDRRGSQLDAGIMEKVLADRYGKTSVLVDGELNAIRYHGDINRYIEISQGEASTNVYKILRKNLRLQLRSAIKRAQETKLAVELEGLQADEGRIFNLIVDPLDRYDKTSNLLLIIFEDVDTSARATTECITEIVSESTIVTQLEDELRITKDQLREAIDSYDMVNEELKSSNEELMSMNQELQSSYEELETSKEELQALNEELSIMNSELQMKVEELAEANAYLENLFKSTNVATIFLGENLSILRFTPNAAEIFKLIDSDVFRSITNIASPIQGLDIAGSATSVLESEQLVEEEVRSVDGRWYLARLFPFKSLKHETGGVVLTLVDITRVKQAEEALSALNEVLESRVKERTEQLEAAYEEAEETIRAMKAGEVDALICASAEGDQVFTLQGADHIYRIMIEQMSESAVTMGADGVILFGNMNLATLLEYPLNHFLGRSFRDFVSPDDQETFESLLASTRQGKGKAEVRLITASGKTLPAYLSLSALHLNDNQAVAMLITDLSEEKKTEALKDSLLELERVGQLLRKAKEDAESANRAKSEFLANMSHEIRTPLNGVLGMLQLMETTVLDNEQKEYLLTAIQSSNRLTRLLADILDLSKIEAGKLVIQEHEFEVSSLKDSLHELFSPSAKNKGLWFECDIDTHVPPILSGDEVRVRQILFNLVGNAIKFTDKGHVRVEVCELSLLDQSQVRLLFSVIDTGIGIPEDVLKDVFEPFSQAEGAYTRRFQGAGLGLSIVRKLIKIMGGELCIDSMEDGGTVVNFTLPFKRPRSINEADAHVRTIADSPGRPLRILLAEDDRVSMITCKRMLEKLGHEIVVAADGQEALQVLDDGDFDLILMDIQMPVMDGVEATRCIREQSRVDAKRRIPIVAMTAYSMIGDRERFLDAGMNDYIAKPLEKAALEDVITRVMATRPA